MTRVVDTIQDLRKILTDHRRNNRRVGFVPTMGAFHEGHLSLMRAARKQTDVVIVSIFVNPRQFSTGEDCDRYPRNLEKDVELAESVDVDIVFAPSLAEIYPKGFDTFMDQENLAHKLCGPHRPGHFSGVLTIVAKLLNIVQPNVSYFGQKDYQQFLILRRMVTDLNYQTDLKLLPTVREDDGLAMSSRNVYLGPKQRLEATFIYRALRQAEERINAGEASATKIIAHMKRTLSRIKGSKIDYAAVVNADSLEEVKEIKGKTLIAVAVRVGKARLIDNILL